MKNPMTVTINGVLFHNVKQFAVKRDKKTGELDVLMKLRKGKEIMQTCSADSDIIINGPENFSEDTPLGNKVKTIKPEHNYDPREAKT